MLSAPLCVVFCVELLAIYNVLFILNCSGPPAAPTNVSGVQSLTCGADQMSLLVNVSWETLPDGDCTNLTVSTRTGYTSRLVCNENTVGIELNCSETYTMALTAINRCGKSDQTAVEITLSVTGTY